jgi:transcription termination factor Rho
VTDTTELLEAPANQSEERGPRRSLSAMLLPELKALAGELGIKGTSGMRKGDLIAAIHTRRASASSTQPRLDEAPGREPSGRQHSENGHAHHEPAQGESQQRGDQGEHADTSRETQHHEPQHHEPQHHEPRHHEPQHHEPEHNQPEHHEPQHDQPQHHEPERGGEHGQAADQHQPRDGESPSTSGRPDENGADNAAESTDRDGAGSGSGQVGTDGPQRTSSRRNRRNRRDRIDRPVGDRPAGENDGSEAPERPANRPNTEGQGRTQTATRPSTQQSTQQSTNQQGDDDFDGDGTRRGRRYRDRNRRGRDRFTEGPTDVEVRDDDVLLPVAGILDVLDSYAFVRTSGYLTGPNDVYVSLSQVRKYGLRRGDAVTGAVRAPRDGEQQQTRQKFNALVRLDTINGQEPEQLKNRPEFTKLTPLYPNERLRLETDAHLLTTRVIDLVMPVGKGQRALIVSPPKAGKTSVLQAIANAIARNNPEVHLMVVLVDERPEEVTDMQRSVKGEVIASTFDRPPADHTQLAELAIERAKRLVEMGRDVVVLLDSITRLGRAYNLAAPASGRILSGGVDSTALFPPKRFLGAARNIEHGGSLTIFASALVETGSAGDTVIFEEFKGTGNAELKLDRRIADKRVFPAIDIDQSSTRKEDLLMAPDEHAVVLKLRRVLAALDSQQALDLVLDRLRKTRSNVEFLMQVAATTPGADRM